MARLNSSMERQITEAVVGNLLKGKRGKNNGILSIVTVLLVAFGFIWVSQSADEDGNEADDRTQMIEIEDRDADTSYYGGYDEVDSNDADVFEQDEEYEETLEYVGTGEYRVPKIERVTVERCVDGDTLIVALANGKKERIRFIGANTPETVKPNHPVEPFGPEASAYTKRRVAEAHNVATLVADGSTYDRYNRRLAFVYLGNDRISLNEELCRQGLAKAETQYTFSKEMKERLKAAAALAEREGLGIYSLAQ